MPASRTDAPAELIAAARRCFARAGYRGASVKAIAAEAGVRSPSILHYHFASKEALFLEVVRSALQTLTARATEIGLRVTEGPRGLEAVSAFFTLLDEDPELASLLLEILAMTARDEGAREELLGSPRVREAYLAL